MTNKQLKDFAGELMLRVKNNETLVKAYLTEAGIERHGHIRFLDLKQLYEVNNDKFMEMFYIIFPEYKPTNTKANAGGEIAVSILGNLFGAASNTLSNIFGSTGSENIIAYQEEHLRQQQKTTYVILAVVAVIAIAIVAFVVIGRNNSNIQVVK